MQKCRRLMAASLSLFLFAHGERANIRSALCGAIFSQYLRYFLIRNKLSLPAPVTKQGASFHGRLACFCLHANGKRIWGEDYIQKELCFSTIFINFIIAGQNVHRLQGPMDSYSLSLFEMSGSKSLGRHCDF